jgi:pimeloyl-ACP methyl ester carboxylesterase
VKRVTRRQALLTGGALAAIGAGAAVYLGPRRIVDRLTRDCGPEPAPVPDAGWTVATNTLKSRFVQAPVGYVVAEPPGWRGGPAVVCLPGRGSTPTTIFDGYRLHDRVAAAAGPAFALVAVDGGESYWHRRADGEDRLSMLLTELIPQIRSQRGLVARGLWGWSMGGYGALRAAVERPGEFRAVATSGAALWQSPSESAPGAFDNAADYARNDIYPRVAQLTPRLFIACGASDPFIAANRALAAGLPRTQTDFTAGCHGTPYWTRVAGHQATFIRDALAAPTPQ